MTSLDQLARSLWLYHRRTVGDHRSWDKLPLVEQEHWRALAELAWGHIDARYDSLKTVGRS